MVLGFKQRFVGRILSGVKIHTIREDQNSRWSIGRMIHFATGVRTKNYKQFATGKCVDIKVISIDPENKKIRVNCIELTGDEKEFLRINDGFDSMLDFWEWFDKPLIGRIIYFRIDR